MLTESAPTKKEELMDSSFDVPDPSDWLQTSLPQLGPVEQSLRCQVCKDFFDTPMITSCSHTFCSLCIRRCLTTDGRCPVCRTQDQAIKLRANSTVQELVDAFKVARPVVLQLSQNVTATGDGSGQTKKRKIDYTDMEDDEDEDEEYMDDSLRLRKPRSSDRRRSNSDRVDNGRSVYDGRDSDPPPGRSARSMAFQAINTKFIYRGWLDRVSHLWGENEGGSSLSSFRCTQRFGLYQISSKVNIPHYWPMNRLTRLRQSPSHLKVFANSRRPSNTMERLPQLNYSLLKDTALRKKLSELGIPNGGPKDLLIRRHTEWVNLVNANCDSSKPMTKRELIHELESWDRTQGRQISNNCNGASSASSVMSKNFDGVAWASNHGNDFQALIAQARRKVNRKVESTSNPDDNPNPVLDQSTDKGCLATSPNRNSAESVRLKDQAHPKESVDLLHDIKSSENMADLDVGD